MIPRYTRPEMGRIWSDENKFRMWLKVEVAATETLAAAGIVPAEAAAAIRDRGGFDLKRIHEVEAEVKHDVIAFTTAVAEKVGPQARWLHYGLTSNDVVDTAQALQVKDASSIIRKDLDKLRDVLKRRAFEFKRTPQIGRTHGIHAEPITFGLKLATWYAEVERDIARFERAAEEMRVGKLSGAVGNLAHLEPEFEEQICERLGLEVDSITTQVISRDRHANYLATLAVIAATLEKVALEVRHLQRTEVREAEEFFSEKQKGSSAMPHKRNPVTCEQICGLARVIRGNAQAAFENVALWHERDISHSSVERVILPDSTILLNYMLAKTTNLIDTLLVYPKRMLANLESTGGLVFSGQVLLDLAEHGMSREQAYRQVQKNAMRAWKQGENFKQLIMKDKQVTARVPRKQIERAFDLKRQLKNVDKIFERVFGKSKKS
ncbi:MAG: adenylosuccinate lyase [Candidatus Koribacter versatilis]|uniref:Adenylosuccinate lyase n=1 Tax=Candidatus Korobacter versatilis TaxID=658062 RepID=A0A932EQ67_9BACT|nr:adenylosuccinate lyase [Candidatus Koribacter versatilis]